MGRPFAPPFAPPVAQCPSSCAIVFKLLGPSSENAMAGLAPLLDYDGAAIVILERDAADVRRLLALAPPLTMVAPLTRRSPHCASRLRCLLDSYPASRRALAA